MRMVYIHYAVRKNRCSIFFAAANRLSSLTSFTDPERYYIELSRQVLAMNLAEGYTGIFGYQKMVNSEAETLQAFSRI